MIAEGLSKRYGKIAAADSVGFRFEEPLVVGLVGPNGAGKTTLIRLMLGLSRPSEGRITIAGQAPRRVVSQPGLGVGYMPQREALYGDLTARQNVAFFARVQRLPRGLRAQRVKDALDLVQLSHRADDRVSRFSGGMRRRVSLACALVHRPRLLVLDEPTVGVDPELRAQMWGNFRDLRDKGALIFISTHYMAEAERCDVVVLMRQGRVMAGDTPKKLMATTRAKDLEAAFLKLLEKEAQP